MVEVKTIDQGTANLMMERVHLWNKSS